MGKDEPAFPCAAIGPSDDHFFQEGLTKREWFAGMAMQGLISSGQHYTAYMSPNGAVSCKRLCEDAYEIADAMLEESND